jgi:peptidyl-tRNA hydrolase
VGPVPDDTDQADFVLSELPRTELEASEKMARRAADCAVVWVRDGIDTAMARFNTREKSGSEEEPGEKGIDG